MSQFWLNRHTDNEYRRLASTVKHHMELPLSLSRSQRRQGSVWAVTMVKNEIDIVHASVSHLLNQGVDGVLIADNGSTDGTLDVLHDLAREWSNVHVARDRLVAYHQDIKMTLLADAARRAGADWIVPFDADEFWFASDSALADWLRRTPASLIHASVHNLFPMVDQSPRNGVTLATYRMEVFAHGLRKVAFRSHRLAIIEFGNHHVHRSGARGSGLSVAHLPWRSLDQFQRKVTQGKLAVELTNTTPGIAGHWRKAGAEADGDQRAIWNGILSGDCPYDLSWKPVGPFLELRPLQWPTWDPCGLLAT